MIRIIAPTIVRFSFQHQQTDGRPAVCVLDLSLDEFGEGRDAAVNTLVAHVSAPWQDFAMSQTSLTLSYIGAHYIDLDNLDGTTGFIGPAAGHPTVGALTSSAAAPQVSYLVKKSCSANRSQRAGRMYLPAPQELEIDNNGIINGPRIAAFNAAAEDFRTALVGLSDVVGLETVAPRVVHIDKHGFDNPADSDHWTWNSTDITAFLLDPKVATQRRRLRG